MPDSLPVPSLFPILCPKPCSICNLTHPDHGICDQSCTHCWSQDPLDPGMHVFEITVRNRLGTPFGEYFTQVPRMGVQVRGFSLHEALDVASMLPFHRWFTDPEWRHHD